MGIGVKAPKAQAIDQFEGEHRYLSNFSFHNVEYGLLRERQGDNVYMTAEHAYQAQKAVRESDARSVRVAPTPGEAKRVGRRIELRPDWEDVKVDIMLDIVRAKFQQHSDIAAKLIATYPAKLIEGNTWGDTFFGCVRQGGEWAGKNILGKILEQVRAELMRGRS